MQAHRNFVELVPILTTPAGRCLTVENELKVDVNITSFYLDALLIKPGLALLSALPELSSYTGWTKPFVLNASRLPIEKDTNSFTLHSSYDGRHYHFDFEDILNLIKRLNPPMLILPEGITEERLPSWLQYSETIFSFFPISNLPEAFGDRDFGVYLDCNQHQDQFDNLKSLAPKITYVTGDISVEDMQALPKSDVVYLETNTPAADGYQGVVYHSGGALNLMDEQYAYQFELIDQTCTCPTCAQGFSRAYLHHLLLQTPLLCQRYLIQHNLHFARATWTSL